MICVHYGRQLDNSAETMLRVDNCGGQNCWHGIIPGTTSFEVAANILLELGFTLTEGYEEGIYRFLETNKPCDIELATSQQVVFGLIFVDCRNTHLGDVILSGHVPNRVGGGPRGFLFGYAGIKTWEYSSREQVPCPQTSSPNAKISFFGISNFPSKELFTWRGFLPYWWYTDRYPELPKCREIAVMYVP